MAFVDIEEEDLERLHRLQGRWQDATGERVTHASLLGLILRSEEEDFGHLTDSIFQPPDEAGPESA